ncbi:MAG TPA: hypothetical protein VK421_15520 [Pyrinomonadaceae bacterium]|nr:hypothetical protein [Pyrinomonadaceae bacterium]
MQVRRSFQHQMNNSTARSRARMHFEKQRVRRGIYDGLNHLLRPLPADRVRDDAPRHPFDDGDDIRGLFLSRRR